MAACAAQGGTCDAATNFARPAGRCPGSRPYYGRTGRGRGEGPAPAALLLLPLLLLPPQLLAHAQPAVARAAGPSVRPSTGVHGVSPVQGAELALRAVDADEVSPGLALLA